MASLTHYMSHHHQHCDEGFSQVEKAAQAGEWVACWQAAVDYANFVEVHFKAEEEILVPPLLAVQPNAGVTVTAMVEEHRVISTLLRELVQAAESASRQDFYDTAENLLILMQEHYLNEERSFYPLWDSAAIDQAALMAQLHAALTPGG